MPDDLGTDLFILLKNRDNHDLVLLCEGGERLEVHQIILGARSVVFKRMTEVAMKEKNSRMIEIKDFEYGVVKEFVNYIYSDKISAEFSDLAELMRIGHQYEVSRLVNLCSGRLIKDVSLDNVALLGTLAETLEVVELSQKCAEFVADNFDDLDTKTLDSVPSSLLRKSLAMSRSKMMAEAATAATTAAAEASRALESAKAIATTAAAEASRALESAKAIATATAAAAVDSATATVSSSGNEMDGRFHYVANFFKNHGNPMFMDVNSAINTQFSVSRDSKLAAIGLYISKGTMSIDVTLTAPTTVARHLHLLLAMTATVTSKDSSKPLKIIFPAPVKISTLRASNFHNVQIKFSTKCVNFSGDNRTGKTPRNMRDVMISGQGSFQIPVLYFEKD